jgi:hypothetical protein
MSFGESRRRGPLGAAAQHEVERGLLALRTEDGVGQEGASHTRRSGKLRDVVELRGQMRADQQHVDRTQSLGDPVGAGCRNADIDVTTAGGRTDAVGQKSARCTRTADNQYSVHLSPPCDQVQYSRTILGFARHSAAENFPRERKRTRGN